MTSRLLLAIASLVLLGACDAAPGLEPGDEEIPTAPLRAQSRLAEVAVGDFTLGLKADAGMQGGTPLEVGAGGFARFSAYQSGVWLGGVQDGATRSSIVYWESNFTTDCGDGQGRLFALDSDTTYTDTEAWPRALGAPTEADGSPRVYGNQMLWGSFCSVPLTFSGQWANRHADPLQGLRMNMAVYRYRRDDLDGALFVRYEVSNEGAAPITDLRVGTFSDTESPGLYARPEGAPGPFYSHDAVAFDPASGLSYVYQMPFRESDGSLYVSTWVSGYTFLDLPLLSHRILRRYTWQEPEGFGQGPASATEVVRALDGLSYAGDPMIDPTTGAPSRFAFSTDPFARTTGWLDGRDEDGVFEGFDVRQLLSAGPVALGAGETLTFTVVWVTADEQPTSFDSYRQVQQTLAAVRAEPSLWRFGPEG
ncbi:hypothetical protein [Rubrivirga sp.]|uniref:hypothetical protein n=1 Tax=Rubrivirga sp. TaxID=1885344 RepID=UPI003B52BD9D